MEQLTLQLKGIMQSYGNQNYWAYTRKTEAKPTKSAVRGLVECALGLARQGVDEDDDMEREEIWKNVEIEIPDPDHAPGIMADNQVAKELVEGMRFRCANGKIKENPLPLMEKEYIVGESFKVILKGDKGHIDKIRYCLQHPVYPYCLGRACCIPSDLVVKES